MASRMEVTVRRENPREVTIIFNDQDGNELGSLTAIQRVIKSQHIGVIIDLWHGNDTHVQTVPLRGAVK